MSALLPDPGHGLDRRNLTKPVHESRLVDDMEDDGGWSASDVVTLEYTTDRARSGTRSLRFSIELRNEDYIRFARRENGSFAGAGVLFEQMPFAAIVSRRFSPAQDWSVYNRLSLWCYVHPTADAVMRTNQLSLGFVCDGAEAGPTDPIAVHYLGDLVAGEWNHIAWELPEMRRDRVSEFRIFLPTAGVPEHGAPSRITFDIGDLCVERVDAEPVDGWAVTPGKIAYCHVGYLPAAEKVAIAPDGPADFALIEARTGAEVAKLPAERVVNRRGSYRVLDFSSVNEPGMYRLRHGETLSETFPIGEDAWRPVVAATLNAFYGLRCGFAVPGVHDACHLDVVAEHDGERRVLGGGWHDAANMTQAPNRTFLSIYALLELRESLRARGDEDLAGRALEEARWGLEWLLRSRFGGGVRATYNDCSYYTDSVAGTGDDVLIDAGSSGEAQVGQDGWLDTLSALAAARAARTLRDGDPLWSAELLAAAEEDYSAVATGITPPHDAPPRQINEPSWRDRIGYLTLAAVELYRASGSERYATDAARFARWLAGTQERRFVDGIAVTGYFCEDAGRTRIVHEYHNGFEDGGLLAFAALCDTFPNAPEWMDWYAGLTFYAEYFCATGSAASAPYNVIPAAVWRRADIDAPFPDNVIGAPIAAAGPSPNYPTAPTPELIRRQMLEQYEAATDLGAGHRLRIFPLWYDNTRHGSSNVHLGKTIGLAAAARTLNRPALSDLAGRQVEWLLGANPFSRSLMYGVGHDYWQNFTVSMPQLVGGLSLGFNSYRDDAPAWGNNAVFPYKELWVFSSCKMAHSLAYVGVPARIRESASAGSAPVVDLRTLEHSGGTVIVEASLSGAGSHQLEVRGFNARVRGLPATVAAPSTERVEVHIEDPSQPWLVVVVPDGRLDDRAEIGGRAG